MATPARLEEGHGMDSPYQEVGVHQQPTSAASHQTVPGHSTACQNPPEPQRTSNERHENFRGYYDILREAPKGWPSIAATRLCYSNFRMNRRFSYLVQRLLLDQETKLACLESKLQELDREDERSNPQRLKSFDPDRLLAGYARRRTPSQSAGVPFPTPSSRRDDGQQEQGEGYVQWNDKDLILESALAIYMTYGELFLLDGKMQNLPQISRREHKAFFEEIENAHDLDEPAYQFLYWKDDFVTTVTDRVHRHFEGFIYKGTPITSRIKRIIGRRLSNGDGDQSIVINNQIFLILVKAFVACTSGGLLLSPVAILFLVDLSRGESFGVLVAFIFAFVVVMSKLKSNLNTILLGLSAYMAVLVTFLSNLEQGRA